MLLAAPAASQFPYSQAINLSVTAFAAGGGSLFVALNDGRVLKRSPGGKVSTIATHGFWPGPFKSIAADRAGDLFVAGDLYMGYGIAEITPAGVETDRRIPGLQQLPQALAVDSLNGDLYIANGPNVVQIVPDGLQTPEGIGWQRPTGLAVDEAGNLYVADGALFKVAPDGSQSQIVAAPRFGGAGVTAVTLDGAGDVFTCCNAGKPGVATTGIERLPAGGGVPALVAPQLFSPPFSPVPWAAPTPSFIAADQAGDVYMGFADGVGEVVAGGVETHLGANRERTIAVAAGVRGELLSADGHLVRIAPKGVESVLPTTGMQPGAVAMDQAGNAYFAAAESNRVYKVSPAGTMTEIPVHGLDHAFGLAVDGRGNVFLADSYHNRVLKVAPGGAETTVGHGLHIPVGLAVNGAGDLYIADSHNNRVVEVAPAGVQTTVPATGLSGPFGVATDSVGDVYIADTGNQRVLEISPSGDQLQLPVLEQSLRDFTPKGIAANGAGDVFISGFRDGVIRLTPGGTVRDIDIPGLSFVPTALQPARINPNPIAENANLVPPITGIPFEYHSKALYLLTASCPSRDIGLSPEIDTAIYYPMQTGAVAFLREMPITGCDLFSVDDDQAGRLYMTSGSTASIDDISVVHEDAPRQVDNYDAALWWEMGLDRGFIDYDYTGLAVASGPGGQSYLLLSIPSIRFNFGSPYVVERFLGEAEPSQPRLQPGTGSDYASIRYSGALAPGMLLNGENEDSYSPIFGTLRPDGVSIGFGRGPGTVSPLPPALHSNPTVKGVIILAATARFFVCTTRGRRATGPAPVYVYDRQSRSWRTLDLPIPAAEPSARIFENWLVVPAAPGHLLLQNLADGRSLALDTGQPDSEVLDITSDTMVYRVHDRILLTSIQGSTMTAPRLIAQDDIAASVHWAFWSAARP